MLLSSALSSKDRAPSSEGRRFVSAVRGDTAFHLSFYSIWPHILFNVIRELWLGQSF